MKKIAALLLISSLITSPAFAQTPPTCDQVLSACDKALNDQIKTVKLQKDLIATMETRTNILEEQNQRLQSDAQMWYHNPLVVGPISFTLGALLAIYVTSRIQH